MKKIILLLISFNLIFAYIGKITALKGDVSIIRNNKQLQASLGMNIDNKDIIKTNNGLLQISFKDKTMITIGKNSTFNIENYFFDNKNAKMDFRLKKGFIKTITGKISKIAPKNFHIHTKNAIIGIRGTVFSVEYNNGKTTLITLNGITTLTNINTGKMIKVKQGYKVELLKNKIQNIDFSKNFSNISQQQFLNIINFINSREVYEYLNNIQTTSPTNANTQQTTPPTTNNSTSSSTTNTNTSTTNLNNGL